MSAATMPAGASVHGLRRGLAGCLAGCALLMGLEGCATVERPDPLESMNRQVFAFNDRVDRGVARPVAEAYVALVPSPARTGLANFFSNPLDLWSALNLLLQGRPGEASTQVMRFATNSTFGLLGLIDIATPAGLERQRQDLGLTLGRWGVPQGAYLVLPLLGPSTLRDGADLPVLGLAAPQHWTDNIALRNTVTGLQLVNTRAQLLSVTRMLSDVALDPYLFVRDAYLQRRQSLVEAGSD